jgi:DNA-binding MarR family transcriptional regulator
MTSTQSILLRERIYSDIADRMERNPVQDPAANGRATVPMGRGFGLWQRMNPGAQLVWIDDADGRPQAITPKQKRVLVLALEMIEGGRGLTMREMAAELRMAPSTVSRALVKFSAWGLIAYIVGRGRWAGLVIFRRFKDDGRDRFRKAAKERVHRWWEAAQARLSRLKVNVASKATWTEIEAHGLGNYYFSSKDATLKQPWTVEELRDSGII